MKNDMKKLFKFFDEIFNGNDLKCDYDVLEYTLHILTTFCNQKQRFTLYFWTRFIKSSSLNELCKKDFLGGDLHL